MSQLCVFALVYNMSLSVAWLRQTSEWAENHGWTVHQPTPSCRRPQLFAGCNAHAPFTYQTHTAHTRVTWRKQVPVSESRTYVKKYCCSTAHLHRCLHADTVGHLKPDAFFF